MEIRIYSPELAFLGLIENQTSLLWTRRYFEAGEFELHAPITNNNIALLQPGNIVWKRGAKEAGVIESLVLDDSEEELVMTVSGRFMESYMDRRLIKSTFAYSGTVENAMIALINYADPIPLLAIAEPKGFSQTVSFQATYKNLLSYVKKLAKNSSLGFRFVPDFTNRTITFEVYSGLDRTIGQVDRNRVIFSEDYQNLNHSKYTYNDQLSKTVVYVGGEGEGSARKIVKVGSASGLELRELFVDAKDARSEGLSSAEYENVLKQRGLDALAANAVSAYFECDTDAVINFVYKKNYELGDVVSVRKNAWGITQDLRITEIQEVYEDGGMTVVPTLGNPLPESVDFGDE